MGVFPSGLPGPWPPKAGSSLEPVHRQPKCTQGAGCVGSDTLSPQVQTRLSSSPGKEEGKWFGSQPRGVGGGGREGRVLERGRVHRLPPESPCPAQAQGQIAVIREFKRLGRCCTEGSVPYPRLGGVPWTQSTSLGCLEPSPTSPLSPSLSLGHQIGRASCRERVCLYV